MLSEGIVILPGFGGVEFSGESPIKQKMSGKTNMNQHFIILIFLFFVYLFRLIRECGAASLSLTLIILNNRKWVIILLAGWTCLSFPEKKQILSKLKTSSYI